MSVHELLQKVSAVRAAPVFGDSFEGAPPIEVTFGQIKEIIPGLADEMSALFAPGTPEDSRQEVDRHVAGFFDQSVAFCPTLAPELQDPERKRLLANLVAVGYWADGLMDGGDPATPLAIAQANGRGIEVPEDLAALVAARAGVLRQTERLAAQIARPEDVERVVFVGHPESLTAQAGIHHLSTRFSELPDESSRQAFLADNHEVIPRNLVDGAGLPCAATPVYALARRHNPSLPPLNEVYQEPALMRLLKVGNALVRICDDLGDWETDSHPGTFTLNLLNQAHKDVIGSFLNIAEITDADTREQLTQAFLGFHEDRAAAGAFILKTFRSHVRGYLEGLPTAVRMHHAQYITLVKRTLEAAWVSGATATN